ncbi:MAG: glycosyltransferase family 4 protein [Deltaproteobacteria bacterium]|nr:glycosyltransferase family 4 protein [Deltaproteobacteria bacterium]
MSGSRLPIWLILPVGNKHGWGVCGKYLALEMSRSLPVNLITEDIKQIRKEDSPMDRELSKIQVPFHHLEDSAQHSETHHLEGPVLQTIAGAHLKPWFIHVRAPRVIGYTFFEKASLNRQDILWAKQYYDWIAAGSTWCEKILKNFDVMNSSTIIQGVDTGLFHEGYAEKQTYRDFFVVFSGGKLELRKGQDLVIRAFKVLQDRHPDTLLVNSWYNMWDESLLTMRHSPYIVFDMPKGDYVTAVRRLLFANGIDPKRVVVLRPMPHKHMGAIYGDTDCGLFPNRCEGGTNLVLMEYMACGKPAIASLSSGHKDILTKDNCIPIQSMGKFEIFDPKGNLIEQWDNPDLEEIIESLEWAYHNRDAIKQVGHVAAASMSRHTWQVAAKKFIELLTN